jgi:hypothetical protein
MRDLTIAEVLERTDWAELAQQKLLLLEVLNDKPAEHPLEGLLNWIDALQDAAEEAGYPVVFLTGDDDEEGDAK